MWEPTELQRKKTDREGAKGGVRSWQRQMCGEREAGVGGMKEWLVKWKGLSSAPLQALRLRVSVQAYSSLRMRMGHSFGSTLLLYKSRCWLTSVWPHSLWPRTTSGSAACWLIPVWHPAPLHLSDGESDSWYFSRPVCLSTLFSPLLLVTEELQP